MSIKVKEGQWINVFAIILACSFIFVGSLSNGHWLDFFEQKFYDLRIRWLPDDTSAQETEQRVLVVDIDEKSLAEEGRWPWSRQRIAELLASVQGSHYPVGVDILFTDFDKLYTNDDIIGRDPFVLAQAFHFASLKEKSKFSDSYNSNSLYKRGRLHGAVDILSENPSDLNQFKSRLQADGYLAIDSSIPKPFSTGHISPVKDDDGVVRRIAPLICYSDDCYEMLSLAMFRKMLNLPNKYQLLKATSSSELLGYFKPMYWLVNGAIRLPLNADGTLWIPYKKYAPKIPYISASDLLGQKKDVSTEGFVLVGATATAMYDQIGTPLYYSYPAIEIHGVLLQALFDQSWLVTPIWESTFVILVEIVLLTVFALMFFMNLGNFLLFAYFLFALFWGGANILLWQDGIIVRFVEPMLLATVLIFIYVPWQLLYDSREKKRLAGIFKAYVPSQVFSQIEKHPERIVGLKPEKKVMSILFADVRGFTALAEQRPPEVVAELMYRALDCMTKEIYQLDGTVDKYMGDAVMAFWGAPLSDTEHANHAVRAACNIQKAIKKLSEQLEQEGYPSMEVGIGISSGEVVVGDIGSSFRHNYTVIGDAVNLAARIQKLSKGFDTDIIISDKTVSCLKKLAHSYFDLQPIQEMEISGRKQTIEIFRVTPLPE